jgi:hypothetical protein
MVSQNVVRIQILTLLFAPFIFLANLTSAHAVGQLSLESNGFLRRSVDRPDATQTISIGPKITSQGQYLESSLDIRGVVQLSAQSSFTVEGPNAYVATSDQLSKHYKTILGRKSYSWSTMDDYWEFGTYSPRFVWDPTRPQKIGMTGVFQQFKNQHLSVMAFGSPLSIPERGFPTREENGLIKSDNPFYTPLYEFIELQGRVYPIRYEIKYPDMSKLLLNPSTALSVRYENSPTRGFWAQASGGYLPIHQVTLNVETNGAFDAQAQQLNLLVYPKVLMHKMATLETGVKAKRFALWGSVTREMPEENKIPSSFISPLIQNALIGSIGGSVMITRFVTFRTSFLHIDEDPAPPKVDASEVTVDLQSRFPFHRATRSHLDIATGTRISYSLGWIRDLQNSSDQLMSDVIYQLNKNSRNLTLNVGADFFITETGKGYIGQYKGNDRVRGAIAYAF